MPAPTVSVLFRRKDDILFGWPQLPTSQCKYYKLYYCPTPAGIYAFLKDVPNIKDTAWGYKTKVITYVKDTDIPIPPLVRYYFKLTFIDTANIESNIALSLPIEVFPPQVEPFWENEDEPRNNHNFGWTETRQRWEKLTITDDGKLRVDATATIVAPIIGTVKVAEKPDNVTLDYIFIDNNRKLVVRIDQDSISRVAQYTETPNVVKNVETQILTYTNALPYFVEKVVCSGTADAVFRMKIGGNTIRTLRNAWNDRNATFDFSTISRRIPAASVVTLIAIHAEKAVQDFEASLEGFTFTI
jgi:hypothetical protein